MSTGILRSTMYACQLTVTASNLDGDAVATSPTAVTGRYPAIRAVEFRLAPKGLIPETDIH